ncbi:hypothetical protein ACVWWO_002242 [Bradyrhizobium sp. F1.13.1]
MDEVRLFAGRQGHRHPVLDHGDVHWDGCAGAVMADAAATRIPRHVFVHRSEPISPVYHHARHDHGDLSAHRAVPWRLRQLPYPADGRRPGHGVPLCEHAELLGLPARGRGAGLDLFRTRRAHRRRLDAVPAAGDSLRYSRAGLGHRSHAGLPDPVHHRLHHGRAELRGDRAAGAHSRHDVDAFTLDGVGHLHGHRHGAAGLPGAVRRFGDVAARPPAGNQLLHADASRDGHADEIRGWQPDPVPASVLVLRSSRGLHRRLAGLRHHFRSDQRPCPEEHLRAIA